MHDSRRDAIFLLATVVPFAIGVYIFISWYNTGSVALPLPVWNVQIALPAFPSGLAAAIKEAEAWRVPGTLTTLGATGLGLVVVGAVILILILLMFTMDLIDAIIRRLRRPVETSRKPAEAPASPPVIVRYSRDAASPGRPGNKPRR